MRIDDLKSRLDIVAVMQREGLELKKRGAVWVAHCPFHAEKSPSFTVWEGSQSYFCFGGGCGEWGDVIGFISKHRGVSTKEAMQYLEGGAVGEPIRKLEKPKEKHWSEDSPVTSTDFQQGFKLWAKMCRDYLWGEQCAKVVFSDGLSPLEYLKKRGLTEETIRSFGLGYNPIYHEAHWGDGVVKLHKGITIPNFRHSVLVGVNIRREEGARVKYGFVGRRVLYNADEVEKRKIVMIVEGEFDAMLAKQEFGDVLPCCAFGQARGSVPLHDRMLLAKKQRIGFCFDNDDAGLDALSSITEGIEAWLPVAVPFGKDITEYWQQGGNVQLWGYTMLNMLSYPYTKCDKCPSLNRGGYKEITVASEIYGDRIERVWCDDRCP